MNLIMMGEISKWTDFGVVVVVVVSVHIGVETLLFYVIILCYPG